VERIKKNQLWKWYVNTWKEGGFLPVLMVAASGFSGGWSIDVSIS
jgi:hypothetical protein